MRFQWLLAFVLPFVAVPLTACRPCLAFQDDEEPVDDAALNNAIAAMVDPEEMVRLSAIAELAGMGTPKAVAAISAALKDVSPRVRYAAIRGLMRIGPGASESVKPLIQLFKAQPASRQNVVEALVSVGADDEEVGKLLLDIAQGKKNNKDILGANRLYAIANLGKVRAGEKAVAVLVDIAKGAGKNLDSYFEHYKAALDSISEIGSTKHGVMGALKAFRKGEGLRAVARHNVQEAIILADTVLRKLEQAEQEKQASPDKGEPEDNPAEELPKPGSKKRKPAALGQGGLF